MTDQQFGRLCRTLILLAMETDDPADMAIARDAIAEMVEARKRR